MTADDSGLFPEPQRAETDPPVSRTIGERMRARQADRIRSGIHPLSLSGRSVLRLHVDASWDPDHRTGPGPRCGGCAHRRQIGGHSRDYPKCLAGAVLGESDTALATVYPYASMSEATDVRAWWPACTLYQPREQS